MVTTEGTTRITVYRADTFVRNLEFKDENSDVIDITNWVIYFTIKSNKSDSDDNAVIKKDITSHTDAVNGETRISMTASETYDLSGSYYYDIQYVKPDGTVKTIISDKIKFETDITRRTTT